MRFFRCVQTPWQELNTDGGSGGDGALIAADHGSVVVKAAERLERRTASLWRERDGFQPTADQGLLVRRSVFAAGYAIGHLRVDGDGAAPAITKEVVRAIVAMIVAADARPCV